MEKLKQMNRSQLASIYYDTFGLPGDHHQYNTLLAALFYGKRIKYLTDEEIQTVKKCNHENT